MLTLSQFDYELPEEYIAQTPAEPRDHSKLLVLGKNDGIIQHDYFFNILKYLKQGDVLVRNNSKVINARLRGEKTTGGAVELLLNREVTNDSETVTWECLTKPGLKVDQSIIFENDIAVLTAQCEGVTADGYARIVRFNTPKSMFFSSLEKLGDIPLPPYIATMTSDHIAQRYQTTYAQYQGSVAAPTAGLHFTPQLDDRIRAAGINICEITLHVGMGTFLPVKTENVVDHIMHEEAFSVSEATAQLLNGAKTAGRRIIAVGTTTTRVLETLANQSASKSIISGSGTTAIFIYPPYAFQFVDGMITNFHLPKSTLLMLVSALVTQPNNAERFMDFKHSNVGKAYLEAIKHDYRFFSFGDAMLVT